ncbi:MAG: hypothetical protein JW726_16730 [Anaerolineales bacterium]|nr:hypothetical protein [Anaerolineales bacterium]
MSQSVGRRVHATMAHFPMHCTAAQSILKLKTTSTLTLLATSHSAEDTVIQNNLRGVFYAVSSAILLFCRRPNALRSWRAARR